MSSLLAVVEASSRLMRLPTHQQLHRNSNSHTNKHHTTSHHITPPTAGVFSSSGFSQALCLVRLL